ncbi:MAG: hypothetical protein FJ116_10685 [Deltaproteobacteria bacterium]|nr:hypothetical protein [Deltaproteobacteria bacterium]
MKAFALILVLFSHFGWAAVSSEVEVGVAKANVAFRDGNLEEASREIDESLKANPEETQLLELKALVQKAKGDARAAKDVYLKLFQWASQNEKNTKRAVYAFELGNLLYSQGSYEEAYGYLEISSEGYFNVEASKFLMGKIDLVRNKFQQSRLQFGSASKAEALRPLSNMYIAQAYQKENLLTDAIGSYVEAKEVANEQIARGESMGKQSLTLAQQVLKNAEKELRSYSRSQWIKEVGIATGYDSNVLYMPNSEDANNISTTGSVKQSLNWRLRYASDPTDKWQYLGTYQGSMNYNFNRTTEAGQFIAQEFSNFLTRGSLKATLYGVKIGGTGFFQYETNAYKPFSLAGSIGPFTKMKINDSWTLGLESFFQPSRNFLDPSLGSSVKRSGWEQMVRAYVASRQTWVYWTPSVFLTGTILRPNGREFSGTRINLDFNNGMYLSDTWFVAQTVGVSATRFPDRMLTQRNDQGFNAAVSGGYQASESLVLLAQMDYGQNFSSDSNFRYNRWATTVAGNYRF